MERKPPTLEINMPIAIHQQDRISARAPHAVTEPEAQIRLSTRDWSWLLKLTENPNKPNAKLKAAMKRYQKAKQNDATTSFSWSP